MVEAGENPVCSIGLKLSIDVLQVVVICEGQAAKAIVVVVVGIEDGYIISAFLQVPPRNYQKVLNVLRDGVVDGVNIDALDPSGGEIYIEFLEVGIINVEDHFSKP